MNSEAPAGEVAVDARPWLPDLNDMLIDDLPSLDDPTLRPAVTALLHDVRRPLSSVAGSQGRV
ncbi:hypothetical protein ACFC09_24935 [Streptomyces sp. NPDC056161]|uniref:hypothetical protein n=1 Tax=Streptomyces sp. NPDC056161 TaxID=3345732 RepID=UPI0035DCE81B